MKSLTAVFLSTALTTRRRISAERSHPRARQRPFGTLREQAAMQQEWLKKRLDTFLPALMRKHGIDMWVVPMREYNEDPVFRRDHRAGDVRGAAAHDLRLLRQVRRRRNAPPAPACVERIALGGTSQGGVFEARRSTKKAAGDVGRGQQAELWGDEQWQALKSGRSRSASRGSSASTARRCSRSPTACRAVS